jgi:hypothetical protein
LAIRSTVGASCRGPSTATEIVSRCTSRPRKVRPLRAAATLGTGRLLPCVAPSTPAWMTHAIRGTEPAVPMLTQQPSPCALGPAGGAGLCRAQARERDLVTSSASGICAWACSPRIAPAAWANDAPLETVTNRWTPMACGPNVDQSALLPAVAWTIDC